MTILALGAYLRQQHINSSSQTSDQFTHMAVGNSTWKQNTHGIHASQFRRKSRRRSPAIGSGPRRAALPRRFHSRSDHVHAIDLGSSSGEGLADDGEPRRAATGSSWISRRKRTEGISLTKPVDKTRARIEPRRPCIWKLIEPSSFLDSS
uniref:Uncharacterized protein n=1 Tax=Setaria viridis TaxID=4556 RepID=A0A4U6SUF5_SETVI|nr:hypothetical protein SEVIR_9G125650v2 [Setaria viridis]